MEATHNGVPVGGVAATTADVQAAEDNAKAYADTLVVGLLDDRGNYDASVNTFPASGGSGTAGAVLKGDTWRISVAGTLGGTIVNVNDWVRALADAPGQTAGNWTISKGEVTGERTLSVSDLSSGGAICTANQLDTADVFLLAQTTATKLVNWPTPNDTTKCYKKTIVNNGSVTVWTNIKRAIAPLRSATFTYNPGVGWSADGVGVQIIAQSGAAQAYPTDTNDNIITLITIPGGFLGANDAAEVGGLIDNTSGSSSKTVQLKFGGTTFSINTGILNATASAWGASKTIRNANSTSAQISFPTFSPGDAGNTASQSCATGAVNTASDVVVAISVQKATGADVTTLRAYEVLYHPGP